MNMFCAFQLLYQVRQQNLGERSEVDEYRDLIQWLDMADQILQIVDEPVRDREAEFSVSFVVVSGFVFNSE